MKLVFEVSNYATSTDYELLWKLMQEQSVICICDYGRPPEHVCRDVAHTIYAENYAHISSRGHGYVHGFTKEEFIEGCRAAKVEFLIPTTSK